MKIILLIDFGSTFTKVTAVDLHKEILLGCASSFTTIDSDINIGLKNAIKKLEKEIGKRNSKKRKAIQKGDPSKASFLSGGTRLHGFPFLQPKAGLRVLTLLRKEKVVRIC